MKKIAGHRQPTQVGPQISKLDAQPALKLHVDTLVLHGFPSANRLTIAKAVERELARLFAAKGVPPSLAELGHIEYLEGRAFDLKPNCQPAPLGAAVASAVYETLAR
jgi:hypothetical protein